ncbi:hypothetical protein C0J52_12871 [Blattella germanica]|nr:hypothetical protein C0J52_12871 [Blattella germanica]
MTLSVECANRKRKHPHTFCLIVHYWKGRDSPCLQLGKNRKGIVTLEPRYFNLLKEQILEGDDNSPSDGAVQ